MPPTLSGGVWRVGSSAVTTSRMGVHGACAGEAQKTVILEYQKQFFSKLCLRLKKLLKKPNKCHFEAVFELF